MRGAHALKISRQGISRSFARALCRIFVVCCQRFCVLLGVFGGFGCVCLLLRLRVVGDFACVGALIGGRFKCLRLREVRL